MSELAAGGRPDLEEVYREERRTLTRLAFLLVGSQDLADDLVQTAFAAVHDRWSTIDNPAAYLRRVVINQARDTYRRREREALSPEPEAVTHIPEVDETWALIQRLPERQRTVVVLRFYQDLALTEIARLLDCPEGTVRSTLHRALKRLRRTLP
jgi:RNA polymerase sigma-70 factor (sigma-E family)